MKIDSAEFNGQLCQLMTQVEKRVSCFITVIKVQGKFTLEQAMKAQMGSSYFFFNLGARWGVGGQCTPWPLYSRERPAT
jgi:hypothetical protein